MRSRRKPRARGPELPLHPSDLEHARMEEGAHHHPGLHVTRAPPGKLEGPLPIGPSDLLHVRMEGEGPHVRRPTRH